MANNIGKRVKGSTGSNDAIATKLTENESGKRKSTKGMKNECERRNLK
jgi:hypothetical protein